MSEMVRILERGYQMMWREDRFEDALIGLDPDFEWVVPNHPEGEVRQGPEATIAFFREWIEPWSELQVDWEGKAFGYGIVDKPDFWIHDRGQVGAPVHVAFGAPDRGTVDEFHRAAVEAGGRDNGEPGPRFYHDNYYGAFVLDPDGNNIEAVCHRPPDL